MHSCTYHSLGITVVQELHDDLPDDLPGGAQVGLLLLLLVGPGQGVQGPGQGPLQGG